MVREKIINWLKKWKQRCKCNIEVEITPAISLFGIINFTFAKAKISRNPEEWREEDKTKITEFLKEELKISLEEFSKLIKEEIRETEKSVIDRLLDEIKKVILESPLIPLVEFKKRAEIKPLLKYQKFIGRQNELDKLHKFLNDDQKIMLITGRGGIGKTRLAIEFADQIEGKNFTVYFIHPEIELKFGALQATDNILLILDEAASYSYIDKVIDFAQNPSGRWQFKTSTTRQNGGGRYC